MRHLEEYPWTRDGLSRTERRLLSLLQHGAVDIWKAFVSLHDDETAFYIADGWYRDGNIRRIDHYIPFAMHYYGLIYAALAQPGDPRAERFRERARLFAQDFRHWFADDGGGLAFGRSLTYRYAMAGFWGALAIFDEAWKRLFDSPLLSTEQRAELDHAPARYAKVRADLLPQVRYGDNHVPAIIPFRANKVAYYRKVMKDPGRPIEDKAADVADTLVWAVRWKLHVRSQPGLLVTLSGIDGSGKSVQADRLRAAFETCDVRVKPIWARGGSDSR